LLTAFADVISRAPLASTFARCVSATSYWNGVVDPIFWTRKQAFLR
jgi:hypothetical protein